MWRNALNNTLGEHVKVKLDLFHAVKRVSSAISKKHPYFYQALQDFRLVFRKSGDNGVIRKQTTPSPPSLLKNLQSFTSKWSTITDHNNNCVLTGAGLKEINNLKVHISRGCLSDIPAHFGTNRNENLHRSLNSRFSGSRLGIEVAVALIAVFLHQWNSKHDGKNTSTIVQLLTNLSLQNDDDQSAAIQKIGIGVSSKDCTPVITGKQHMEYFTKNRQAH